MRSCDIHLKKKFCAILISLKNLYLEAVISGVNELITNVKLLTFLGWGIPPKFILHGPNLANTHSSISSISTYFAKWVLLIGPLRTNFSEILIEIHTFSFKRMQLKMLSVFCQTSCMLVLKDLIHNGTTSVQVRPWHHHMISHKLTQYWQYLWLFCVS